MLWKLIAVENVNRFAEVRDVHVSKKTIRSRLNAIGVIARRLAHGPELYRVNRIIFVRVNVHWSLG